NLIATASETGGQWQIDLSWQDNSADEDGFEIERKIGAGVWEALTSVGAGVEAYTDGPPLAADTLYTYRVRAFRNDVPDTAYSAWSNEASAATSLLAAPTNLSAAGGEREAFLYWTNNSPGALGFEIQRSHLSPTSPTHNFVTIGYAEAGAVSYTDELTMSPNIPDGRPYYYRIRAYDSLTTTDWSEIAWTNPIPSAFPYGEDPTNFEILPGWNTIVVRFNDNTTSESSYVMEFWKKIPNNIELPYAYAYLPAFAGATTQESALTVTEGGNYYIRLIALHSATDYGYSRYATPAGGGSGYVSIELPGEAGTGGASGSCFIATAAFGSPYEKHVKTFRNFRDRRLLTNKPGRAFVRWYYRHSPSYADYIRRRPAARVLVRTLLRPLAWLVSNW
ncbi:MAG: hypothetical protein JW957_07065, partial [Candidatus Omnitrophica bacterium]|nr:hypothetical protein [Candidatus Omnitrophota bacterium]